MISFKELEKHKLHHLIIIEYTVHQFIVLAIKCQECGQELYKVDMIPNHTGICNECGKVI